MTVKNLRNIILGHLRSADARAFGFGIRYSRLYALAYYSKLNFHKTIGHIISENTSMMCPTFYAFALAVLREAIKIRLILPESLINLEKAAS